MKMGGQFAPETGWSVWSGKHLKCDLFRGGQFAPESGGQFDRILHQQGLSMRKIGTAVNIHHRTVAQYLFKV